MAETQREKIKNKILEILESIPVGIRYSDLFRKLADYLVQDLGECTKAISLGGNKFGDKWGTPDVFGVYKFSEADAVRPPVEIVSVEIKTDTNQLSAKIRRRSKITLLIYTKDDDKKWMQTWVRKAHKFQTMSVMDNNKKFEDLVDKEKYVDSQ